MRNAAGDTPLAGCWKLRRKLRHRFKYRQHRRQRWDKRHLHLRNQATSQRRQCLGVTDDGVVYIPVDVAPLPTEGLSLTAEITANDKAPTAKTLRDSGRHWQDNGEICDGTRVCRPRRKIWLAPAINPASPPAFYRLLNDPIPGHSHHCMPVAKVVASGGTPPYRYVVFGTRIPTAWVLTRQRRGAIQTGQTGDDPAENKVRKVTVRITDNRQPNAERRWRRLA